MIYLNMNEAGFDTDRIGFPGVLGCQAYVWKTTYIEYRLQGDKISLWLQEWFDERKVARAVGQDEAANHKSIGSGAVTDIETTIADPDKSALVQFPLNLLQ